MASVLFGLLAAPLFCLITAIAALPSLPLTSRDAFTLLGCFTDNVDGQRALSATSYADDSMTVESCATFCAQFNFFGVEYGRECYCGNSQATSSTAANDSDCSFPCAGNVAEICGAGNRLDIYVNNLYSPPEPASLLGIPYIGCFIDSGTRVLPDNIISTDNMTAANCAQNCAGYIYFGTEWGRECYCGDSAPTNVAPESDCSFLCTGSDSELCGASMRLNVYGPMPTSSSTSSTSTVSPTLTASPASTTSTASIPVTEIPSDPANVSNFVYQGCYTDSVDARVLTGSEIFDASMTLEMCAAACVSYGWFGVEYGTQCYCGAELDSSSIKSPESDCEMQCGGDTSQICGDANRINVYSNPDLASAASNLEQVGNFSYSSCWTDDVDSRSLTGDTYRSDNMTVESCAAFCEQFTFFGVEYSRECYCGNEAGGEVAPETDCSELCMGDAMEWCGGPNRLNLYVVAGQATASSSISSVSSSTSTSSSFSASSTTIATSTSTSTSSFFSASSTIVTSTSTSVTTSLTSSSTISSPTTTSTSAFFPSSTTSSTSTTAPPQLTTITSCPLSSTWVGSPTSCWASVPSPCTNLNNPTLSGFGASISAMQCSRLWDDPLPTLISSCFPRQYNTVKAQSIYNCLTNAPIYCSYTSVCTANTYVIGQEPTATPTPNPNLLINGGFESGDTSGWSYSSGGEGAVHPSVTNSMAHSGTYSWMIFYDNTNGDEAVLTQSFTVEPGAEYTASVWWYHENPNAACGVTLESAPGTSGSDVTVQGYGAAGGKWNQFSMTWTTPTSYLTFYVYMVCNANVPVGGAYAQDTFYIDDVVLQRV